jgi:hypothetical protein
LTEANAWEQVIDLPVTPAQESQTQVHNAQMALPPDEQNSIFANLLGDDSFLGQALGVVDSGVDSAVSGVAGAAMYAGGAIAGAIGAGVDYVADFVGGTLERSGNLLAGHGFRTDAEYADWLVKTAMNSDGSMAGLGAEAFDMSSYSSELNNLYPEGVREAVMQNSVYLEGESQRDNMALTSGSTWYNMCNFTAAANVLTDEFGITAEDGQKEIEDLVFGDSDESTERKKKLEDVMKLNKNLDPEKFSQETIDDINNWANLDENKKNEVMKSWISQVDQLEDTMDVIREVCGYGNRTWAGVSSNVIRHFDMVMDMKEAYPQNYADTDQPFLQTYGFTWNIGTEDKAKSSFNNLMEHLKSDLSSGGVVMSTNLSGSGHIVRLKGMDDDGIYINDPYGKHNLSTKGSKGYGARSSQDSDYASTYHVPWSKVAEHGVGKNYRVIRKSRKAQWWRGL